MNEVKFKTHRLSDIDPLGYDRVLQQQQNRLTENMRCDHPKEAWSHMYNKCLKCGSTKEEIYKRLEYRCHGTIQDVFTNGEFTGRRIIYDDMSGGEVLDWKSV